MKRLIVLALLALPRALSADTNPPTLPQLTVDTTYRSSTPGNTTHVASGGNLQTAITDAACGDTITLEAGATFSGTFTLPDKDCSDGNEVYIISDALANLPEGTRVGPGDVADMPKITRATTGTIIEADNDADHYRFAGLEIEATAASVNTMIDLSNGTGDDVGVTHIIFDRCYVHGHATSGTLRGLNANGENIAVIDSYFDNFKWAGADSQAIAAWDGAGPYHLENNYLEGAGENVLFGGADASSEAQIPQDITVRFNHFDKRPEWNPLDAAYDSSTWTIKNIFELKNAKRVLIEGNHFERCWVSGQSGYGIVFTVRNQSGGNTYATVSDVTFRANRVEHMTHGINTLGTDNINPSAETFRWRIEHNFLEDIGSALWGTAGGRNSTSFGGPDDVGYYHNTYASGTSIVVAEGVAAPRSMWSQNVMPFGTVGFFGTGKSCTTVFDGTYFTDPISPHTDNVIWGSLGGCASAYTADIIVANEAAVGFVDETADDYRMDAASDYYGTADNGSDYGAWWPAIIAAKNQLDWSVAATGDYDVVTVTYGTPGLPTDVSCDVRIGNTVTVDATGDTIGTREVIITDVAPGDYFVGVDCGDTWGGWLQWDPHTAAEDPTPGSTSPVLYSARPPAFLSTVARMTVECADNVAMTSPNSAQDTTCTSAAACDVTVDAPEGLAYCRHIYQTSGDVAIASSKPQVVSVQ